MKKFILGIIVTASLQSGFMAPAMAASKKKAAPITGKKVIMLKQVQGVQVEMPDQSLWDFGQNYWAALTSQFEASGKYIVVTDLPPPSAGKQMAQGVQTNYVWDGTTTPSATIQVNVESLNFTTGLRGEQMFYGFDERTHNSFNDGTYANEFPLRILTTTGNWFGRVFDQKGIVPFDSHSGLDLGDGFDIDILFAYLNVKYAKYHSELHLQLNVETPSAPTDNREIQVQGNGFFFDVVAAYQAYSAGISVARSDAMRQALYSAISGAYSAMDRALSEVPLMAKIDNVLADGTILLGTGIDAGVQPGIMYSSIDHPEVVVQVSYSVDSGAVGTVIHGNPALAVAGITLKQVDSIPATTLNSSSVNMRQMAGITLPSSIDSITLPNLNLPAVSLVGYVPTMSRWAAFLLSLEEAVTLPYRIYRYFMYDQTYHTAADGVEGSWSLNVSNAAWAKQVGFDAVSTNTGSDSNSGPIVAVLDSGIDYNHPTIHDSLALNPQPWTDPDGRQDRYGWDFVSGDSRPYDDGYHGTQVASLVAAIAPQARILPVKIFNPWGITNSGAMYGGFVYAVDHGAQIIVCGWSTIISSKAIRQGVQYAHDHGVVVVAAAGDDGVNLSKINEYPAVLSRTFDNVVTVASVDSNDQLVSDSGKVSNYDVTSVMIAAPGKDIQVAQPRSVIAKDTSSGLSAAIVAGAMARGLTSGHTEGAYHEWIQDLLSTADTVPALELFVDHGLRLHIRN